MLCRIKIRAMFDKMMKELTDKRLNLLDISNAVKRAEATQVISGTSSQLSL